MIVGFLRGLADFIDAVQQARSQQRTGFSEREAGDYLDLADTCWPVIAIEWRGQRPDRDACTELRD